MKYITHITRKELIQTYVNYDARKKNCPVPANFSEWTWSDPNALDSEFRKNKLKAGIITGYKTWQLIELSYHDLLNCAVVNHIFSEYQTPAGGFPRVLSQLVHYPEFQKWKPNRPTEWYEWLEAGAPFPSDWPLILRPAVRSEAPAKWYIEDGSGRALSFLRRLHNHPERNQTAKGYLGAEPDFRSSFMQQHFQELLIQS